MSLQFVSQSMSVSKPRYVSKSRYASNSYYNLTHFNRVLFRFPPISSLYLPAVENLVSAEYIVNAFEKAGIAHINVVVFESKSALLNRVYLGIKYWHDTEAAYNFIAKLRTQGFETRFVHDNEDELWWAVDINKFPHKIYLPSKRRTIVLFNNNYDNVLTTNEPEEETTQSDFLEEKYSWVDARLEDMTENQRLKYELIGMEDYRPIFC